MLTDMVGYSLLTQRDEATALALVREQERIVRRALRHFGGREVKGLGDGFLLEFGNALDAVRCAVQLQTAIHERNLRHGGEPLALRIGVHLGDVVHRGRDVFGDAINIVARIEPLAEPGGLCVSQPVLDQIRGRIDLPFDSLGTPRLKHIVTPVPLYRARLATAQPAPTPSAGELPRVAVLPLANISGRSEDDFVADGVTEELIQMLSKIRGLRVIARASVMRYRRSDAAPSEIARTLGATAVVEGGMRKQGAQLRITARLIDAGTGETLWSAEFDRTVTDLFAVQSEISQRIARSLEVEILGGERIAIARPFTGDPHAHLAYLQGRYFLNQRTGDSLRRALASFDRAVATDPRMAAAYAGRADALSTLSWLEFLRPRYALPRARAAAQRSIALDPTSAEAHASLGFVRFLYDRDWVEAEREFRRALSLNPNLPTAHQYYSDFLKAMGRLDEALAEVRRALELDPLSLAIHTALGHVLYLSRRYPQAIEQYRTALELDPTFVQAHLWFGRPYLETGRFDEAIREVRTAVELSGESTISLAVLAHALASAGRPAEAREILARLLRRGRTQYVPSYWIALVHVGLGDRNRAFAWLDRARRERSSWLAWVKVEPRFDSLRSDPRFGRLLRQLNLS